MDKNKLALSLLVAVIGLLMLLSPETFIAMVVIILGVAAIVNGVFIMVTTRNLIVDPNYQKMMTTRGILSIIAGVVAIVLPLFVAAVAWKIMAYVLAGYLLISAALETYGILQLHRNGIMVRQSIIETAVSVILAAVLFIIPAKTAGSWIVGICGVVLLVCGITGTFLQWRNRPVSVVPDAVVTEDDEEEVPEETEGEK